MITGVTIGGVDTLARWGLILLADLKIESPTLKSNLINVPGRNGSVNMSYAVSNGEPVFDNGKITFTLFKAVEDIELKQIRDELAELCHGREQTLILPINNNVHYKGLFHIGDVSGYNTGKIAVSVITEPHTYSNT